MAFVPFTDCAEGVIQGVLAGQVVMMTLGLQKAGGFIGTDLQDTADEIALWVTTDLLPILVDDLEISQVKVQDLTSVVAPVVISTVGLPDNGGVVGVPLTNNAAFVMSFKTALRGRTARGRNYIPGPPTTSLQTATEFSTAFAASVAGVYEELRVKLNGIGVSHVVLSRFFEHVERTVGVSTLITNYLARIPVGTQRRRIIGHGV